MRVTAPEPAAAAVVGCFFPFFLFVFPVDRASPSFRGPVAAAADRAGSRRAAAEGAGAGAGAEVGGRGEAEDVLGTGARRGGAVAAGTEAEDEEDFRGCGAAVAGGVGLVNTETAGLLPEMVFPATPAAPAAAVVAKATPATPGGVPGVAIREGTPET